MDRLTKPNNQNTMKQTAPNTWQIIEDDYRVTIDDNRHRVTVLFKDKSPVHFQFETNITVSELSKVMEMVERSLQ